MFSFVWIIGAKDVFSASGLYSGMFIQILYSAFGLYFGPPCFYTPSFWFLDLLSARASFPHPFLVSSHGQG